MTRRWEKRQIRFLKCVVEDCEAQLYSIYVQANQRFFSYNPTLIVISTRILSPTFQTSLSTLNANITSSFLNFHDG